MPYIFSYLQPWTVENGQQSLARTAERARSGCLLSTTKSNDERFAKIVPWYGDLGWGWRRPPWIYRSVLSPAELLALRIIAYFSTERNNEAKVHQRRRELRSVSRTHKHHLDILAWPSNLQSPRSLRIERRRKLLRRDFRGRPEWWTFGFYSIGLGVTCQDYGVLHSKGLNAEQRW